MTGPPDDDDARFARLTDPANPRTPLHFKRLDHQRPSAGGLQLHVAPCDHHRTTGYACGAAAGARRPISKLFDEDDDADR